jgi:hypothetical protein
LIRYVSPHKPLSKVTSGNFYAKYKALEWTSSVNGQDGVFLVRENGKIIREHVDGTKETVIDERSVYYVFP